MSNLSKLLKFENFNTEHLSVAVDMNSGGEMSKFVIPLFDNFAKRNFNIFLFLPVFKGDVFYLSSALSFFWKLRNVKDELYLLRNGMIETKFTYSDGIFLAKETGEMLIPTKNNSDDEIKITDDNNLTYYFQMPSLSSKGTYNLKRIEYPDGFRLLFDDKVNFVLKTENMNEKTSPIWMAEFDLKRTDDIQEFKIYTKLGEEERIYCKGSITKKENTATYYTIDIININENGKEYKRKYEYQVKDDYNSLSYLEDDKRTESINFYEEGDNLEIRLYGQVKEHRYNLERGLDYIKLEDKTYTDYPLSKIYTLRKSSDISYYYITSSYSNNGYGSCFNLDEKGRIIETADNIPYVCSKDNLLKNIPTNINVVEDKNFAFNNLVNSSSYLLESGKNIVFETSTMVLSQNKYLATLFIKKLEETKEAKIRLQIINGEEKEETYLIDEYIPSSSYVFSCLGYIAKKSNTKINVKIENIGTSKVFIKEVQLLKNYGTIKYEYEEDKVKSISDGEKRIENFYDENGRAIYSYVQQKSGITTYKKNNKYNLPEKVEDYLGNIQENEYTHVPKEYQIETEGNWKVTKSRAKVGKETFEQEREYDDETWNLIKEIDNEGKETKYSYGETEKVEKEESSVEIEKDKEGRVISYKFTYPKVYDAPLINEQRYEKDLLSRTWASYREEEKDKLIYEYDEYQRLKRIKTEKGILVNEFTYDENDQVLSTKTGTSEISFSYDEYGRLISDSLKDESYSYDNFGNILTKRRGDKFYQYLYEDNLLKEIRNNKESIKIEYGTSLYPKKIIRTKDNKEENIELNYIGRRLEKVEVGGKEYKYTYDDQGQRIKKEGNGKEEYYFYEEGRIKEVITKEYRLIYRYVGEEVKGVTYKNENKEISYFYEKNILGEIIGIVDEEGKRVVEYRSSSYGEVENIHDNSKIEISAKDHLRYKGYIYDEETRLYYLKTRYYDPEIGRFISPDSIDYQSPESINGLNLYAYCGNDPINMVDPTGHFWDTVLDILFIGWDIYNLITNEGYKDWKNWAALLVDLAFAAIPFVTGGGGQVVKLANVADDISDFSKVTVIGESMSREQTISQFVNATDNLYDGFKSYKKLSSLGKGGKVLAEIGGKSSNIAWLYGKLRSGYKVIDIGIDTVRTTRSSSYIVERITIAIWKSRNIWKWIYHLDF
ncbi:MAG: RHS repeat-associated core domain-containing protein [Bacilli bacterium]